MDTEGRRPLAERVTLGGGAIGILVALVGLLSDISTLWGHRRLASALSKAFPYGAALLALALAVFAVRQIQQRRVLEQAAHESLHRAADIWTRFVRVLAAGSDIQNVPDVAAERLNSLFDELVKLLPSSFGSHHKFSVARPNADGTFSLLATRGMDPAAVAAIESQASWQSGRSFYASLLNDSTHPQVRLFSISDSAYVDTRKVGDARKRSSSSGSHLLFSLRDEDAYRLLPHATIAIVSVGVPKSVTIPSEQIESLHRRLLPAVKAIEGLLVAASVAPPASQPGQTSGRARPERR